MQVRHAAVAVVAAALVAHGAAASMIADFQFQNGSLASSVGSSVLVEDSSFSGTPGSNVGFTTDTVEGSLRGVYGFGDQNGFEWDASSLGTGSWTFVIAAKLSSSQNAGFSKLLDFGNLATDEGLYVESGSGELTYYDGATFPPPGSNSGSGVQLGTYQQYGFSYDASTNMLAGFIDGAEVFTVSGSISMSSTVHFFMDDQFLFDGGEWATGSVARISIFGEALSAEEIAGIEMAPVIIPLPAPVWMGLAGLAGVAVMRRRRVG